LLVLTGLDRRLAAHNPPAKSDQGREAQPVPVGQTPEACVVNAGPFLKALSEAREIWPFHPPCRQAYGLDHLLGRATGDDPALALQLRPADPI
jgi:hypothetical protein